ncbi:MAG: hypothetical protein Q4B26_05520 [Eubacteriales bacterium]|nr:hypothetical protein [Eubacteriales bacterium]
MTYTVKDLIEELKHYPEDAEVHFNLEDDIVPSDALINYEVDRYGQIQK